MSIPSDFDLPDEYKYSEEIAVKKLRPFMVSYKIEGHAFTEWSEVMAQLQADQQAYEEWQQNN